MDRWIFALLAAAALLGAGGCSANLPAARVATPPAAPPPKPAAPATITGNLGAVDPDEIRAVMVDLNLAHTLDVCGFPGLASFMRDYTQKRIDSCPNSAERKAALHSVMESTALRERRQADEARANGDPLHCYASDKLAAIKEMIPIAQRVVARAEKPMDCGDISSAER